MDYIEDLPPSIQNRLPEGPDLTAWLLIELKRAQAAALRAHVLGCEVVCRGPEDTIAWLTVMRTFVLKHRAFPIYVTNVFDPSGLDVQDGWYCQECGLDRDGPIDEWPCEVLVMFATLLWYSQRPNLSVTWAWTPSDDQLVWGREGVEGQTIGGQTNGSGREPVRPEFGTHDGKDPADDALGEHQDGTGTSGGWRWPWPATTGS